MPMIGGLYSGIRYFKAPMTASGAGAMDDFLETLVSENKQDSVVSVFIMPEEFYTNNSGSVTGFAFSADKPSSIDGYTPRNKKLLTYPFTFVTIDVLSDSHNYRWEWFADAQKGRWLIRGAMTPNPELIVVPVNYNGKTVEANYTEHVTLSGFPQVAWPIDSYKAWLAQKATSTGLGVAAQAVGTLAAAGTGNVAGVVTGALGIASTVNNSIIEATKGSTTRGNQSGSALAANGANQIYVKNMCITRQYARMIDSFFDRYGYSCGEIKVPNRNTRPQWNYVKCDGAKVFGNLPTDARETIQDIYNKGVTFWRNADNVGNYALDNTI